jgi:hypothetical protein
MHGGYDGCGWWLGTTTAVCLSLSSSNHFSSGPFADFLFLSLQF